MKKLFLLALFAFSAVLTFAADPAKFLPADSGLVFYADGLRMVQAFDKLDKKTLAEDDQAQLAAFYAVLQKHSITLQQIFSGAFYVAATGDDLEDVAILFNTTVPAKTMPGLLTDLFALSEDDSHVKWQVVKSGDYVIYAFLDATDPTDKQALCLTYVASDVMLAFMADVDEIATVGKDVQELGGSPLLDKLDRSQLLSLYCKLLDLGTSQEEIQQYGFDKFAVSLNLFGANQKDAELTVKLGCLDQQHLQQLGMQISMMVPMMLGMTFGNDPAIAADLQKGLTMTSEGNVLAFSLKASEELINRVNNYCANRKNFQPAPVNPDEDAELQLEQE